MAKWSSPTATKRFAAAAVRFFSAPAERSIPTAKHKYVSTSGTYPKGFLAGTAHAGVKASNTKYDDIALVTSEQPCAAGIVSTKNIFRAAPVVLNDTILSQRQREGIRSVIVNSGCANAVTGELGRTNAAEMAITTDKCFDPSTPDLFEGGRWPDDTPPRTLVMSTGVIGQLLPIDRIKEAIPKAHASLGSTHESWMAAAQAICTTDTFPKLLSRTFTLPSHPETEYRIAGMTKGAGMIHPNMGTLLGIICTDAKIAPASIKRILAVAANKSFNAISIDGDTSTNDTVALLANAAAAPPSATALDNPDAHTTSKDTKAFIGVLSDFMVELAQLVVRDGEGATKFVTIRVLSSHSKITARRAAASIATSALVKTALYGKDANWGRILCAIGYAPGIMDSKGQGIAASSSDQVQPLQTSVSFIPPAGSGMEELQVFVMGKPQDVDEVRAKQILELEDIEILVKLDDVDGTKESRGKDGEPKPVHEAVYWTCDFSHEYVTINGDYRT